MTPFFMNYRNDKKPDGFTLIETLAAVVLILIITLTISTALIAVLRNNDNASASLYEAWLILYADQELRKKIEPVIFPYWENSVNAARILRGQIMENTELSGITITEVNIIMKEGSAHGLHVSYSVLDGSAIYTSTILFSSAGDAVKR